MVCVIVCFAYIEGLNVQTTDPKKVEEIRQEVENVFRLNCSSCRNYRSAKFSDTDNFLFTFCMPILLSA